jgi:hypothetical protein
MLANTDFSRETGSKHNMKFKVLTAASMKFSNYFTRQYNPEDNSEKHNMF